MQTTVQASELTTGMFLKRETGTWCLILFITNQKQERYVEILDPELAETDVLIYDSESPVEVSMTDELFALIQLGRVCDRFKRGVIPIEQFVCDVNRIQGGEDVG